MITIVTTIKEQIIIAFALGVAFGWLIGCLIMDARHSKILKQQHERNQELEKLLSNGK